MRNNLEKIRRVNTRKLKRKEIAAADQEIRANQRDAILTALEKRVHEVDAPQKALTGRTPEKYVLESGVPMEELFPEDATILNIGDPWQKLDLPGVTSIDYELGEEAEFIDQPDVFLEWVPHAFSMLTGAFAKYPETAPLAERVNTMERDYGTKTSEYYNQLGEDILKLASELPQTAPERLNPNGFVDKLEVTGLWYLLQRLGRGFKDIWLINQVINPAIQAERVQQSKRKKTLSPEEEGQIRQQIIHDHRFQRRMKYADLIKATFPNVPFADHSFDRITASWSISTHVFPEMTTEEFQIYWDEIDRLLKKNGICFMWPLYTNSNLTEDNTWALHQSLLKYAETGGDACLIRFEEDGSKSLIWINEHDFRWAIEQSATLVIFPRKAPTTLKTSLIEKIMASDTGKMERPENSGEEHAA